MRLIKTINRPMKEGAEIPTGYGLVKYFDTTYNIQIAIIPLCYLLRICHLIIKKISHIRTWERDTVLAYDKGYRRGYNEGFTKDPNNLEAYALGLEAGKESSKRKKYGNT